MQKAWCYNGSSMICAQHKHGIKKINTLYEYKPLENESFIIDDDPIGESNVSVVYRRLYKYQDWQANLWRKFQFAISLHVTT
jgi:hypothetical protein